jgi:hypothetical protein
LPAKPTKWGVKLWNMADSDTGYMHCFQIYTGKEDAQEKGSSYRVVMDLNLIMLSSKVALVFGIKLYEHFWSK